MAAEIDNGELKTVRLDLPARTDDLRGLEIGTVVISEGRVFTAREGVSSARRGRRGDACRQGCARLRKFS